MDFDSDTPSAAWIVVAGLAASLLVDVTIGGQAVLAQDGPPVAPAPVVPRNETRAGCPTAGIPPKPPPVVSGLPPRLPDAQMNRRGTVADGAAGSVPREVGDDPCRRGGPLQLRIAPSRAASAASSTSSAPPPPRLPR